MTAYSTIRLQTDERGVATLSLARPDKHNAIDAVMMRELRRAAAELATADNIRSVIIASTGPTFCAGADLNWMQDQIGKDRAGRIAEATEFALTLRDLDTLGKLVVGRVQGPAYGGGVGLMCICDVVIAANTAKFALTETRLGLAPSNVGPYVLRRLGEGGSRQMFFNSRVIGPERALQLGLVSRVTTPAELDAAVDEEIAAILKCAPGAVAEAKAQCRAMARDPAATALDITVGKLADRWESAEGQAGLEAFFARRPPPWQAK